MLLIHQTFVILSAAKDLMVFRRQEKSSETGG
jgi:hypothetical protein